MTEFLQELLSTEGFHPHGYCYLWRPSLIWLHVISDALIGIAYVAIGMTLAFFVKRGSGEIPFSRIFVAFGVFIAACGATHFMEIWTLWNPVYWLSGSVKVVTAAASVLTAMVLPPLVPLALNTIRSARVSERRKEELESAHSDLAQAHGELNRLFVRLKEADETKTRFFANVSHELRTPLTLILGPAERLARSRELTPEDRQQLDSIQRNASLLLRHVNDLLDVQKVAAGEMPVRYVRLDLARALRLWIGHFESVAADRDIGLSLDTPASLEAEVDPEKLERVVLNLFGNALKFTPDGGRVRCTLSSAETGEWVVIEVHDSGPGIPPHQREVIFEPFRQLDDAPTRRFGGTGLGLAIVREFVQLHGGTVQVDDSAEGGALFRVTLPTRAPEGAEVLEAAGGAPGSMASGAGMAPALSSTAVEAPVPIRQSTPAGNPAQPLVLVVEDNPEMNAFIVETLSPEFRVAYAFDGRSGVEQAIELVPDLILSDIMMPGLSGDALVRELRARAELAAVPILLLSARADDQLRIQLLREGVQDYLTKPFSVEELLVRVRNWSATKRARDILQQELDTTLGDVEALAREVALRNRELDSALAATRLALTEAEEANRAKADFLSVMSHELRTPLNAITGYIELLDLEIHGTLTDEQRTEIDRIRTSSNHLLRLIEEVLTYTHTEAGRARLRVERLDLGGIVRETAGTFAAAAASKGLELQVRVPTAPALLPTDEDKVRRILANLIGNAVKFTTQGGVEVGLHPAEEGFLVRVRDTGVGIEPEHLEKIFEPFWQADVSKTRRFEGTGLGLAIVSRLVKTLDGEIRVQSIPGRGTEFTVWLPPARRTEED